jgi:hypothetical protein
MKELQMSMADTSRNISQLGCGGGGRPSDHLLLLEILGF